MQRHSLWEGAVHGQNPQQGVRQILGQEVQQERAVHWVSTSACLRRLLPLHPALVFSLLSFQHPNIWPLLDILLQVLMRVGPSESMKLTEEILLRSVASRNESRPI